MCKFICNILIKIRVPLFPRGMKVTKNFWNVQIIKNKIIQNYTKLFWNARRATGTAAGSGTRASQYASFTHGAETAETNGGTIPHKSGIQLLAAYPALSVTIRHYPALSGNRYSKKQ